MAWAIPQPIRPHRDDLYCTSTQTPSLNHSTYGLNRCRATNLRRFAADAPHADRQTGRQADKQTDRPTDRPTLSPRPSSVRRGHFAAAATKIVLSLIVRCEIGRRERNSEAAGTSNPCFIAKILTDQRDFKLVHRPVMPSNDRRAPRGRAIARRSSRPAVMAPRIIAVGAQAD